MPLRKSHGRTRPETARLTELPKGVPQAVEQVPSTSERTKRGTWAKGASTAQASGGKARRDKTRLAARLALGDTFADPRFEPYARAAKDFRRTHVARLAREVGSGECGPAPASIIATSAIQLAGSRFAFEVLGDLVLGSRLGNDSRTNLIAAHELCAREAQARADRPGQLPDIIQVIRERSRQGAVGSD